MGQEILERGFGLAGPLVVAGRHRHGGGRRTAFQQRRTRLKQLGQLGTRRGAAIDPIPVPHDAPARGGDQFERPHAPRQVIVKTHIEIAHAGARPLPVARPGQVVHPTDHLGAAPLADEVGDVNAHAPIAGQVGAHQFAVGADEVGSPTLPAGLGKGPRAGHGRGCQRGCGSERAIAMDVGAVGRRDRRESHRHGHGQRLRGRRHAPPRRLIDGNLRRRRGYALAEGHADAEEAEGDDAEHDEAEGDVVGGDRDRVIRQVSGDHDREGPDAVADNRHHDR